MTTPQSFGSVGDAYANFHLRTAPADKDLKDYLKKATDDANAVMEKAGAQAGADYSKGLADGVERSLRKDVRAAVNKFGEEKVTVKVNVDIDTDRDAIKRGATSLAGTVTRALRSAFKSAGSAASSAGSSGGGFLSMLGGGATTLLRGLGSSIGNVGSAGPLAPIIGGALIVAIGGIIGAVAALLNVLGPLINSLLLLPGLLAVVVAAFGPLIVVFSGFTEAVSAFVSGDADAIAEVMKSLGPNTAAFAKEVAAVIPWLRELKKSTQEAFFGQLGGSQFTDTMEALKGVLGPGFAQVTTAAGKFFSNLLATARDPAVIQFLEMLFTSAAGFWDTIGPAVNQLILGLSQLGIGTLPYIDNLLKSIGEKITQFGLWLSSIGEDGRLQHFLEELDKAWTNLKDLAASGWNLLKVIVGEAGEEGRAQTFFDSLVAVINILTEFFKSEIGAEGIRGMVFAAMLLLVALGLIIVAFTALFYILEKVGQLFEWIVGTAVRLYNILSGVASLINFINGRGVPASGGALPKTAEGGVFMGAQARIIAEAGPEAVIPLNDPNRAREIAVQSGLTSILGGNNSADVNIGQGAVVINNYGGVPNREQTAQMAAGAMDGIAGSLARRNTRQAIRTMGAAA